MFHESCVHVYLCASPEQRFLFVLRATSDSRISASLFLGRELGRGRRKEIREESNNVGRRDFQETRDIARPLWYGNAVSPRTGRDRAFPFFAATSHFRVRFVERRPTLHTDPIESPVCEHRGSRRCSRQALINTSTRFPFASRCWMKFSESDVFQVKRKIHPPSDLSYEITFLVLLDQLSQSV